MPGYYVHLAASNKTARKNRSFVCGVEIPDLLKYYVKTYTLAEAKKKYDKIKTEDMPNFSFFEKRVQQVEKSNNSDGMHYGWSSNPDIFSFWNSLTNEQKQNPFFIGYLWHLLTDLLIYKHLNIDSIFNDLKKLHFNDDNLSELINIERDKIHSDWDKINVKLRKNYSDVVIPEEIRELEIIKYIEGKTYYVDWNIIQKLIEFLQKFDPMKQDIDIIIEEVMNFLPNKGKEKIILKK